MNHRSQDFRSYAAMKIAASLAAVRHQHQLGPAYTPDQVTDIAISMATMLTQKIIKLEAAEDGAAGCDTCATDAPPKASEPASAPSDAPPTPPAPVDPSPPADAPKANVEPPKATEVMTRPETPKAKPKPTA